MKNTLKTFRKEIFIRKYLLLSAVIAFLYISLTVELLNYRFALGTVFGDYTLLFKANVFIKLLEGIFTALSKSDAILLVVTGLLVGFNISLLFATAKKVQGQKLKVFVGGGSILGLASTGCASCGFSVLSVVGLGTSLSFLPFGSNTLYIFSIGALLLSIYYMTKKLADGNRCLFQAGVGRRG